MSSFFPWITKAASSGGIPATIVDAKGDLIAATAADTVARLPIGADTLVLTADAAEVTGMKWGPGGLGGTLTTADEDLTPAATSGNGSTTGLTITATPLGATKIEINGLHVQLASDKLSDAYFSADAGVTAKAPAIGDTLFWNGIIAGYDLSTADRLDFIYEI